MKIFHYQNLCHSSHPKTYPILIVRESDGTLLLLPRWMIFDIELILYCNNKSNYCCTHAEADRTEGLRQIYRRTDGQREWWRERERQTDTHLLAGELLTREESVARHTPGQDCVVTHTYTHTHRHTLTHTQHTHRHTHTHSHFTTFLTVIHVPRHIR